MSELISGKDALIALANGQQLELKPKIAKKWLIEIKDIPISVFDSDFYEFRLKPRTITINGIEVPAPFEPNIGDYFYVICPTSFTGYTEVFAENQKNLECFSMLGAWRTEEEIEQVVAALRSIFNKN